MTYNRFAYLYDDLMKDVNYKDWVDLVEHYKGKYAVTGKKLLDIGCGTGELSIQLAKEGYFVTGVDLSEDMLAVAKEKAERTNTSLFLVQQDMTELTGLDKFDVVCIFCDSLNYLLNDSDIIETFKRVNDHLNNDGIFLFDVHSTYKLNELFINQTYAYNGEDISYIWQCFEGEYPNSVEHELTFFTLDDGINKYDRYDELHVQRTFPIEKYEQWLLETGFEILEISADFKSEKPNKQSERIFFTARKK